MPMIPGTLRSLAELELLVSLYPCPACSAREVRATRPYGGIANRQRRRLGITAICARCAGERTIEVEAEGDLTAVQPERFHLGGDTPATTITPAQLLAELDRVAPHLVSDVERLDPAAWRRNGAELDRAITCLVELLKFVPPGAAGIDAPPDAGAPPERFRRTWLTAELLRWLELDRRRRADAPRIWAIEAATTPVPRGELTSAALQRHGDWLRGDHAGRRLELADVDATGSRLHTIDLTRARLERVTLAHGSLSFSTFDHVELLACDLAGANLSRCGFAHAQLVRSRFDGADLGLARLHGATVTGGSFEAARLDRTSWHGTSVHGTSFRGARFGNAAFDGAHFVDCDLRGADLALLTPQPMGTTKGARFERCDLRDTRWAQRDLDGASFLDCRWHGARGRPSRHHGIEIIRPELSAADETRSTGSAADVLALLTAGHDGA